MDRERNPLTRAYTNKQEKNGEIESSSLLAEGGNYGA